MRRSHHTHLHVSPRDDDANDKLDSKYGKAGIHANDVGAAQLGCRRACMVTDQSACVCLFGLGILTRFYGLSWPREVVFDEVHFGKFVSSYITGRYYFDIHPPLGKLLIAAAAWYSGYDGRQPFERIGEPYLPHVNVYALRAVPATFGALLVPLTYGLGRQLGASAPAALLSAGLVLLDGAALVESRLLVTDSMLFFFELSQLLTCLRASACTPLSSAFHGHLCFTFSSRRRASQSHRRA